MIFWLAPRQAQDYKVILLVVPSTSSGLQGDFVDWPFDGLRVTAFIMAHKRYCRVEPVIWTDPHIGGTYRAELVVLSLSKHGAPLVIKNVGRLYGITQ